MLELIVLIGLFFFGLFSAVIVASETSILMLTPGRAGRLVDSGAHGAIKLEKLIDERHLLRAASLFIATLCSTLIVFGAIALTLQEFDGRLTAASASWAALVCLGGILIYFVLFQALPRAFAVTNPEFIALGTAGFSHAVTRFFAPLMRLLSAPAKGIVTLAGGERKATIWAVTPAWVDEDTTVDEHHSRNVEALIDAVTGFDDLVAREVMTPRTDMYALEDTATVEDAIALIVDSGVSRIPVYHESIDDIRGVLFSKDLLRVEHGSNPLPPLLSLCKPAVFVPETKPVTELMAAMRTHTHLVIVTDEYGGTSGLVTLEDLLEEIVGDISDEFDTERPEVRPLGFDVYDLDARMSVSDLNDLFDTTFDIDADSVGGLFTEIAGHIPRLHEEIDVEGITLKVSELDGNRIERVIARPSQKEQIHE